MKKKEYIFKMANLIKNRVMYHAPIEFTGNVDFERIARRGIDLSLPIFVFEKDMSSELLLSFIEAQKQVRFNLIIDRCDRACLKKIHNCFWVEGELLKQIKKLDINYKANSRYKLGRIGDFLKIFDREILLDEKEFCLEGSIVVDGVVISVKKYLLSGECLEINVVNTNKQVKSVNFEYNKNLPHGYYYFEKKKKSIKITSLMTNEEMYLNLNVEPTSSNFSCVDGVESSAFAKINFKIEEELKACEKRSYFVNFGKNLFTLKNQQEMDFFYFLSQKKNCETFDIKIESTNKFFERSFNRYLPQKIWKAWVDGGQDLESENEYINIKNSIVIKEKKGYKLLKSTYPITTIYGYDGKSYKKIAT